MKDPEGEAGAEEETPPAGSELVAEAGTLELDSLVPFGERIPGGGESHLEFADMGEEADDATTELFVISGDVICCASCGIP